jgi:hypothetical protein
MLCRSVKEEEDCIIVVRACGSPYYLRLKDLYEESRSPDFTADAAAAVEETKKATKAQPMFMMRALPSAVSPFRYQPEYSEPQWPISMYSQPSQPLPQRRSPIAKPLYSRDRRG